MSDLDNDWKATGHKKDWTVFFRGGDWLDRAGMFWSAISPGGHHLLWWSRPFGPFYGCIDGAKEGQCPVWLKLNTLDEANCLPTRYSVGALARTPLLLQLPHSATPALNRTTGKPGVIGDSRRHFQLVQSHAMNEPARSLLELLAVVETLRGPDGCPWDQEQSIENIGKHLLEESSEVLDAIEDSGGLPGEHVCEELGDVLMNIFMASVIAAESGAFGLPEVAEGIRAKLVRRHPHVFGDKKADSPEEVLELWNSIKAEEKKSRGEASPSRLDGVPRNLPTVLRAEKISRKAAGCGFDWKNPAEVVGKLREEIIELEEVLRGEDGDSGDNDVRIQEELGDILFTAVNLCRKLGCSADEALGRSTAKFINRFHGLEGRLENLESCTHAQMNDAWEKLKEEGQ